MVYALYSETNKMSQVDIVVLPTLYVCAIVTGFLLNTCSKRKIIEKLEEQNSELDLQVSMLTRRLEEAETRLHAISEHLSEPIRT